jgi:cell division protein YceG involved in septum cleavage
MPTISLTRVANSPAFAQAYTVNRSTGSFQQGGYVSTTTARAFWGIVQPATEEDLQQVPEGDRSTGMMGFISEQPMHKTRAAGSASGIGDTVTWRGQDYRVVAVTQWGDFGFFKAIAARLSGE